MKYVDAAIRVSAQHATMTFEELVKGCTAGEREQLAWHLAMLRARRTVEALAKKREVPAERDELAREIMQAISGRALTDSLVAIVADRIIAKHIAPLQEALARATK